MASNQGYVTDLRPSDVLFGRGSGPNDHEGNIRFRQLVAERKSEYMATNHRMTKAKIAKEIVDMVFVAGGRFMKKVDDKDVQALGLPEETDVYEIVGDDTIMEKAKQALRQNTQKEKGKLSPVPAARKTANVIEGNNNMGMPPPPAVHLDDFEPLPIEPQSGLQQQRQQAPMVYSSLEPLPVLDSSNGVTFPTAAAAVPPTWEDQTGPELVSSGSYRHPTAVSPPHEEEDSMLAYVRQNPSFELKDVASNESMAQIPQDIQEESRRTSLHLEDLKRMSEMEKISGSFSKMTTGDSKPSVQQMNLSQETMGTIEHMPPGSVADMSIATMGSSTFSFRGNESLAMDERIAQVEAEVQQHYQPHVGGQHATGGPPRTIRGPQREPSLTTGSFPSVTTQLTSNSSMSLSDVWGMRRKSSTSSGTAYSQMFASKDEMNYQPRPVGLPEEAPPQVALDDMGLSSLSMIKSAFSINDGDFPSPQRQQAPQGQSSQQDEEQQQQVQDNIFHGMQPR